MRRTIPELLTAAFAGDALTPADATRLPRHAHHAERIDELLQRGVSPEDRTRSEAAGIGAEFKSYRSMILRDLRSSPCLSFVGSYASNSSYSASSVNFTRPRMEHGRPKTQHSQAGKESGPARRKKAETFLTTLRAAKILPTSEGPVRALERRGELPCTRTSSGVRLFDPAVVERVARERATTRRPMPPEAA